MPGNSVWVLLIVLAFSGLSWVYRSLQEQKAKRNARDRSIRREEAVLRTGRDPNAPPAPPLVQRRSEDSPEPTTTLAERQERLRAMQQRASSSPPMVTRSASQPTPGTTPGVPAGMRQIELWPGGPKVLIPAGGSAPSSPAPARTSPPPPDRQPSTPQRPARGKRNRGQKPPRQPEQVAHESREREAAQHAELRQSMTRQNVLAAQSRADSTDPTPPRARPALLVGTMPTSPAQWRQTLILNEILSPPISERREQ